MSLVARAELGSTAVTGLMAGGEPDAAPE